MERLASCQDMCCVERVSLYWLHIEELLYNYFWYSQHVLLSASKLQCLSATYLSQARYYRSLLSVPLNPNQSITESFTHGPWINVFCTAYRGLQISDLSFVTQWNTVQHFSESQYNAHRDFADMTFCSCRAFSSVLIRRTTALCDMNNDGRRSVECWSIDILDHVIHFEISMFHPSATILPKLSIMHAKL